MGGEMSREEAKTKAKAHWTKAENEKNLRAYVNRALREDSDGGGQARTVAQNDVAWVRLVTTKSQELIVDKTPAAHKWIAKIVFGSGGVGSFLLNMLFSLGEKKGNDNVDEIERRVKKVVGKHMANERLNDLQGIITNMVQITFTDRTNADFLDLLYRKAQDLREKLNSLWIAIGRGAQAEYTAVETLQAFIWGHNVLCTAYLTIHNIDKVKVTAKSWTGQVRDSKKQMLDTSWSWVRGVFAKFKVEIRNRRYLNCLVISNGEVDREDCDYGTECSNSAFVEETEVIMRAELAKYCTEIITGHIEPNLPEIGTVEGKLLTELSATPLTLSVHAPPLPSSYQEVKERLEQVMRNRKTRESPGIPGWF